MEKLDLLSAAAVAGTTVVACSIYTVFQKTCDHIFDDKLK